MDVGEWGELRPLLHPYLHFDDGRTSVRGRAKLLAAPPGLTDAEAADRSVEIRDGQVYRWVR